MVRLPHPATRKRGAWPSFELYEAQMLQTTGWYANESAEVEDRKYRSG